jgi:DNA replication protein DnaC
MYTHLDCLGISTSATRIAPSAALVTDDFAISPIGSRERNDLLEPLDDRAGNSASILESQLPVDNRNEYLNDTTPADAIMDGLVYSSYRIEHCGVIDGVLLEIERRRSRRRAQMLTATNATDMAVAY